MDASGQQARIGNFARGEGGDADLAAIDAALADHDHVTAAERIASIAGHAGAVRGVGIYKNEAAALADDADAAAASDAASGKGDQARWQP